MTYPMCYRNNSMLHYWIYRLPPALYLNLTKACWWLLLPLVLIEILASTHKGCSSNCHLKLLGINIRKGAIKTVDILACFSISPRSYPFWKETRGLHMPDTECKLGMLGIGRDYEWFITFFSPICLLSSLIPSRDYCLPRWYQKVTIPASGDMIVSITNGVLVSRVCLHGGKEIINICDREHIHLDGSGCCGINRWDMGEGE